MHTIKCSFHVHTNVCFRVYVAVTSCLIPSCYFYFTFFLSSLSCLSSPLTLYFPNPSVPLISPVSASQLPTLNQQAAEDCGNPWNRRDQGCRQGATATLECGASEEIRAVSPARERGGMLQERSEGGGRTRQSEEGETETGRTASL